MNRNLTKKYFSNYLLTIGFILLLVIFLASMVFISRTVLSNQVISQEKQTTNSLLENLKKVEVITTQNQVQNNETLTKENFNLKKLKLNSENFNLNETYFLNINENKSIFTVSINGKVGKIGENYFIHKNANTIFEKDDLVIFNKNQTGRVISFDSKKITKVLNSETNKIENIPNSNIKGKIFIKNG